MPSILDALSARLDEGALSRLSTRLGADREELGARAPGVLGAVGQLLDRNKDGSVLDDVGGLLGGLFGRR